MPSSLACWSDNALQQSMLKESFILLSLEEEVGGGEMAVGSTHSLTYTPTYLHTLGGLLVCFLLEPVRPLGTKSLGLIKLGTEKSA